MLRMWNAGLIVAAFVLSLLGTFLVRSGILDSIHAFGASTLGKPFLVFILAVLGGSVALLVSRRADLRSQARLDSLLSREAFFLLNNLVLVGICFVIFWGTFFPLISEAVTGTRASVGPPWFDRYTMPLALVLVLLAGVGPLLAWRRVTRAALRRALLWPGAAALCALAALLLLTPAAESPASLALFAFAAFVLAAVGQELWRGAAARRAASGEPPPVALARLVARNRRRYGGYTVHAGIALLLVGVAASSAFAEQRDLNLSPGQSARVGDHTLTYREPTAEILGDRAGTGAPITLGAVLDVERRGGERFVARPSRNYYPSRGPGAGPVSRFFEGEATSEVDVRWGLRRDLWIAIQPDLRPLDAPIAEGDRRFADAPGEVQAIAVAAIVERYRRNPPPAAFRAIDSPLVAWIWIGGAVVLIGALTALWPASATRRRIAGRLYAGARANGALEAAKEAKYREIRDAELDYRMGKLSEPDFHLTDRELRTQALEILREQEEAEKPEAKST